MVRRPTSEYGDYEAACCEGEGGWEKERHVDVPKEMSHDRGLRVGRADDIGLLELGGHGSKRG